MARRLGVAVPTDPSRFRTRLGKWCRMVNHCRAEMTAADRDAPPVGGFNKTAGYAA